MFERKIKIVSITIDNDGNVTTHIDEQVLQRLNTPIKKQLIAFIDNIKEGLK